MSHLDTLMRTKEKLKNQRKKRALISNTRPKTLTRIYSFAHSTPLSSVDIPHFLNKLDQAQKQKTQKTYILRG